MPGALTGPATSAAGVIGWRRGKATAAEPGRGAPKPSSGRCGTLLLGSSATPRSCSRKSGNSAVPSMLAEVRLRQRPMNSGGSSNGARRSRAEAAQRAGGWQLFRLSSLSARPRDPATRRGSAAAALRSRCRLDPDLVLQPVVEFVADALHLAQVLGLLERRLAAILDDRAGLRRPDARELREFVRARRVEVDARARGCGRGTGGEGAAPCPGQCQPAEETHCHRPLD